MLNLDLATRIIQGARAAARAQGVNPLSFVVAAPGGEVILLVREDGANPMTARVAQVKAATASGFRASTSALNEVFAANPAALLAISTASPLGFAPLGGGVPIFGPGGEFLGAAAAAGDAPPRDEACISAGVESVGLSTAAPAAVAAPRAAWPPSAPAG
jgi:uncharacterized protein GlcG (DUF336 family)